MNRSRNTAIKKWSEVGGLFFVFWLLWLFWLFAFDLQLSSKKSYLSKKM